MGKVKDCFTSMDRALVYYMPKTLKGRVGMLLSLAALSQVIGFAITPYAKGPIREELKMGSYEIGCTNHGGDDARDLLIHLTCSFDTPSTHLMAQYTLGPEGPDLWGTIIEK